MGRRTYHRKHNIVDTHTSLDEFLPNLSWLLLLLLAHNVQDAVGARQAPAAEEKNPSLLCQPLPSLVRSVPVGRGHPSRKEQLPTEHDGDTDFDRSGVPWVPSSSPASSARSTEASLSSLSSASAAASRNRNNGEGAGHSESAVPSGISTKLKLSEDDNSDSDLHVQQAPVGYFYYHDEENDGYRGGRSRGIRSVGDLPAHIPGTASSFFSPSSSPELNCSLADRQVAVQVRHHPHRRTATAGVFICPSVKLLHLQIIGGSGSHFIHVPVKVTLMSCARFNDTAVVDKELRHRLHIILRFSVTDPSSPTERLNYSYSLHTESSSRKHQAPALSLPAAEHRWKRAVKNQLSTLAPLLQNANSDPVAAGTTTDCGKSRSCISSKVLENTTVVKQQATRGPTTQAKICGYGFEGCGHLTCDYMLSYHVINSTYVDMELSARDAGWVAVGFSSDKFMGGSDDVILCKRQRTEPPVTTMSLGTSVKHTPPIEKENRLEMLDGRWHDRNIYCRVRRPLEFKKKVDNSDLDLVNDWHQLYAFGFVDGTGRIQQHIKKPWVSKNKITMVRVTDITVITNAAPLPLMRSSSFLFSLPLLTTVLTLTFTGS